MANFGRKTGSLKKLKETLAKGGNGTFIKYIPKNGELNVRFIQEPEEWVSYSEHYDMVLKASFPCSGERDCPGCVSGERKSSRYLANVVNLDDKDQVIPLQLPKDLANRLVIKYEKWGSVTDRDIELSRSGEGLDTTYDLDPGAVDRKSIAKYVPLDLLKTLEDVYDSVFGAGEAEDEEDEKPATRRRPTSTPTTRRTRKPAAEEPEEEEEDDDDEPEAPAAKPTARATRASRATAEAASKVRSGRGGATRSKVTSDEDDDEDEAPKPRARRTAARKPAPEPEDDDDEEVEYDEDDLKEKTLGELRAIARQLNISTKGKDQDDLIDDILDGADDGEPPF
jgi:hypothetical protein